LAAMITRNCENNGLI